MKPQIRLTRKVTFSSGHRFWRAGLSSQENKALYGEWASPHNHGHNFVLCVTVEGEMDEATGMVVNIKTIDDVLQRHIVQEFAQKSINDEVAGFDVMTPCLENLLPFIALSIEGRLGAATLTHLRLEETPLFYGEWRKMDGKITLTRIYEFCASHRLHIGALSEQQNASLFGKCNNPTGHGHNYVLEVTVSGKPDPRTGLSVDITAVDRAVAERVLERYDHKHLNSDVPELEGKNPTSEVVAQAIFEQLEGNVPATLERVLLKETDRSWFEVLRDAT